MLQNVRHFGQLTIGNVSRFLKKTPMAALISPRWLTVTQANTMQAISFQHILRSCRHLNRGCDGNLVGTRTGALATATSVVHVILNRLWRCSNCADAELGLRGRRGGQASLVADILGAWLARAAWAVGDGAGHQALLTVHGVANVNRLAYRRHLKVGDDGMRWVCKQHFALPACEVRQSEDVHTGGLRRKQEVLNVRTVLAITITVHSVCVLIVSGAYFCAAPNLRYVIFRPRTGRLA